LAYSICGCKVLGAEMRILRSCFVLLLLTLYAAGWIANQNKPLDFFSQFGIVPSSGNPLVSKLFVYFNKAQNPDILLLGSSVLVVPAFRCDEGLAGVRPRYDQHYISTQLTAYDKANSFAKILTDCYGRTPTIVNLGIIASMVSDSRLIFEKSLAVGKRPKLVICCIAPREFLDNLRSDCLKSPILAALSEFDSWDSLFARHGDVKGLIRFVFNKFWPFFEDRLEYRKAIVCFAASYLHRPITLYDANRQNLGGSLSTQAGNSAGFKGKSKPEYSAPFNDLRDLDSYRSVYLPVNEVCWQNQVSLFEKMLIRSKSSGTRILIVNMPLTASNKELLPRC
jgi:hypothetical protein